MPTIDEAIRVNTVLLDCPILKDNEEVVAALQLDNEALKRIRKDRNYRVGYVDTPLPGETPQ